MPAASFIPGPGDSAVENNPLTQVGRLSEILNSNAEAQNRLQLTQLAAQESQMRLQSAALENQRMNLIISMMPEEHRLEMKQKAAAIASSTAQSALMTGEAFGQGLKNIDTLNPWSNQNQLQASLLRSQRAEEDKRKFDLDQAKEAANEWKTMFAPSELDAKGMPRNAQKHYMGMLAQQKLADLQLTQQHTDTLREQANYYKAQSDKAASWVDVMQDQNDIRRASMQVKGQTMIEVAKIRASAPKPMSFSQAMMQAATESPDPEVRNDATMFLLQSHNVKPEDVAPTLSPSGDILPGHKDTEGFAQKVGRAAGILFGQKRNVPSTQPIVSGTVRVRHPDGRTGTIPRSQLEQAKKMGFKEE